MNKSLSTRFRQWLPATSARWAAPWAALPRTRQWWTDAGIAAVVIGVSLAGSYAARSWHPHSQQINLAGYLLIIVSGTSLVARRRYPVLVLGITLVTSQLSKRVGHADLNWLPLIVAFFATVQARRRAAAIGIAGHRLPGVGMAAMADRQQGARLGHLRANLAVRPAGAADRGRTDARRGSNGGSPRRASGSRNCCGWQARSGCGSPGTCTTSWRTTSR